MYARNYSKIGKKWLSGEIISIAQRSVKVKLFNGLVIHRHLDQIRKRSVEETTVPESNPDAYTYIPVNRDRPETVSSSVDPHPEVPAVTQLPQNRRYPQRVRRPPDRLNL